VSPLGGTQSANSKKSLSKQTHQQNTQKISSKRKTVRQQTDHFAEQQNSSKTHKISKQQQEFRNQVTARAVFRPETSGPGIFTA
jgi:hypothetical protein